MRLGRRRPAPGSRARAFRARSRAARAAAPRRRARGTRRALDATRPAPAPPARKRPRRAEKRRRGTRRGAPLWTSSSSRESSARRSWSRRRPRHRSSPPGRVARRSPRGAHQGELSPRTTTQGRQRSTERRATPRLALDCQVQGDGIISVRLPSRLTAIGRVRVLAVARGRCCGGGSDGICVVGLQILAPIAAVSSRALWQFGRGRGEKSPHSACDCCRRGRTRPLAAYVVDSTPCCARLGRRIPAAIGFGSLASLEPSSH